MRSSPTIPCKCKVHFVEEVDTWIEKDTSYYPWISIFNILSTPVLMALDKGRYELETFKLKAGACAFSLFCPKLQNF